MSGDGVRSLERGLALLCAMNADPSLSVAETARRAGVPRSTAYRLLETLQTLGYVAKADVGRGLRLTEAVRRLSDGYVDENWLDIVWPELLRGGGELFWPLSLFTMDGGTMVIRRTTHAHSTMSIDYGMGGRRMPLMETAAGRAYLAFCPPGERDWLLGLSGVGAITTIQRDTVCDHLTAAREDGFGRRFGGAMPRTASLSVPVMAGERVLCCISIVWIASVQTMDQGVTRLAAPLRMLARRIEAMIVPSGGQVVRGA